MRFIYDLDLHRHDEFSSLDGFGSAIDNVRLAKKKGITALGIAKHGNMKRLVRHWKACLEEGVKPILGVEAYFQPKFDKRTLVVVASIYVYSLGI